MNVLFFILKAFAFAILFYPIVWEYRDDKDGDFNKRKDVLYRILWSALVTGINTAIFIFVFKAGPFYFLKPAVMTFANFLLIFDYWIATRFSDGWDWFNYLGKYGAWARLNWWVRLGGWGRFAFRVTVFVIALIIYF